MRLLVENCHQPLKNHLAIKSTTHILKNLYLGLEKKVHWDRWKVAGDRKNAILILIKRPEKKTTTTLKSYLDFRKRSFLILKSEPWSLKSEGLILNLYLSWHSPLDIPKPKILTFIFTFKINQTSYYHIYYHIRLSRPQSINYVSLKGMHPTIQPPRKAPKLIKEVAHS